MVDQTKNVADADNPAFAVFRSARGRVVASFFGVVVAVLFIIGAVRLPGADEGGNWGPLDRLMLAGLGLAISAFLFRYAMIKAVPTRDGLFVRNLLLSRRLEWSEIVAVNFAGGDPWVRLDLTDTDQLAVMAIQKADGPARSQREAARLAALVEALGTAAPPAADAHS